MSSQSCPLHPVALAGSRTDDVVHPQEKLKEGQHVFQIEYQEQKTSEVHTSAASVADETTAFFNL